MRSYIVTRRYVCEDQWRITAKTKAEAIELAEGDLGVDYTPAVRVVRMGDIIEHRKYTAKLAPTPAPTVTH